MNEPAQAALDNLHADAELDLRGVICPYNFVKTKLKLETMQAGQILAVILDEGDPIRNVPRSVSDDGHTVLAQELLTGAYRVTIRKRAAS
ncbi:MAG: sulfurtransferase TusA family protein [Nitrospirae bacterium]|nr:MAG: sulfurtransferase TusA family protein [Nitrospirota bacterium]